MFLSILLMEPLPSTDKIGIALFLMTGNKNTDPYPVLISLYPLFTNLFNFEYGTFVLKNNN